ncbi:MAG: ABC transporter permease [Thermoleophilaceae bacterium]|nr:ABC transporter permease [Thermoleophilaceae bacterium]
MRRASAGQNLPVVGALARRSIVQTFRRPQFLAPILLFPTLLLAINTGGAGRAVDLPAFPEVGGFLDFQLAASTLQATMLAAVSGGVALALDFELGFNDRLLAAPIPRWVMIVGRLAGTAIMGVVAAVWFLAIGLIFGAEIVGGPAGALVVIALSALSAAAFGGLGAALAVRSGQASVVQGTFPLAFVILFLSSAFFPQELMQEPAATAAAYNPLSFIVEGLREPVLYGVSGEAILHGLGGVAIVGIVGVTLTALAMRARLRAA